MHHFPLQLLTLLPIFSQPHLPSPQKKYEKVIYAAGKVLALDEKNVKALYRRAKAYKELGDEKKAARDLDRAMELAPGGMSGVAELSVSNE